MALLIREAFLQGISTRQVGWVVAPFTGEPVSAQSVSKLTRDLEPVARGFHQVRLNDDWAYLFLDGVSLRVRRPAGRKRVQMLVGYGVRRDGSRQVPGFQRSLGESQAAWGLLQDLYRRDLEGKRLALMVTDGCPGPAAALPVVYPRVLHQRCWVHTMGNILEEVHRWGHDVVKQDAQGIYQAGCRPEARKAFSWFRKNWWGHYPAMVRQLERDLPELLSFFSCPPRLWRKLRTTNVIKRGLSRSGGGSGPWSVL